MTFEKFFAQATGFPPYGYQVRMATDGLPPVVQAPTGTGKTAVILVWLWRRLHDSYAKATPRRLVFALPQRTLVEQVAGNVAGWLENLGLTDEVPVHVVMGGAGATQRRWRTDMDRATIVIGTIDSLVSKALNRGYGISRSIFPIDFALVTNGVQWVIDEIQLCPESTSTLRQLAAFADPDRKLSWPTAEPFRLTCMSATVPEKLLDTVDNPFSAAVSVARIEPEDRVGGLARRLDARRTVRYLECAPGDAKAVAAAVSARHRPATLTLVVVNTVAMACDVFVALRDIPAERTLIHSRFRATDRDALVRRLTIEPGEFGHVVVSTQVVEAGVDINATTMIVEAAPWPSIVQRAGRCNRTGDVDNAEMWWLAPAKPAPYAESDVAATVTALTTLEGSAITCEDLLSRDVATTDSPVSVIRRPDLLALFDTSPDLTGADVDIAPYVRDGDDLDVELAWANWESVDANGRPPANAKPPRAPFRCRVPVGQLRPLAKTKAVWRFDHAAGEWSQVSERTPARPGEILVMAAKDGGYDPVLGFKPQAAGPVAGSPVLGSRPDPAGETDPVAGVEDAYSQDDASVAQAEWLRLNDHCEHVRHEVTFLLKQLTPDLPSGVREAVIAAGFAHDVGKAHPIWQNALCALAADDEREFVQAHRPWAKSASPGQLVFEGVVNFRHELVSLLLLDGPLRGLLDGIDESDLARYLVLAHHGKLRVQVRGPDEADPKKLLGLEDGTTVAVPPLLGRPEGQLTVNIGQFTFGDARSWTRTALQLRDRFGPFLLAYLETLVRIADWRASAKRGVARGGSGEES